MKNKLIRNAGCPYFSLHHQTQKEFILLLKLVRRQNKKLDVHGLNIELKT